MPRLQRLTDFIARLLGKEWDVRALDRQRSSGPVDSQSRSDEPGVCAGPADGPVDPVALTGSVGPAALERPTAPSLSGTTGWLRVRPC